MSIPPQRTGSPMHKAVQNLIGKQKNRDASLKKVSSLASGLSKYNQDFKSGSTLNASSGSNIFTAVNVEQLMKDRLKFYNLDFDEDADDETFTNPESRHFTRDFRYKYEINDSIPFQTETHVQQSKYLCHVLVNLYISISSKDIQGIIPISAKDISSFKDDIEMIFGTEILQLSTAEDDNDDLVTHTGNEGEGEEEENDSAHGFGSGGKITVKSSTIVNVVYWTTELTKCLHFEIPVSLRKTLCGLYYNLALVKGQKVNRTLFVDTFVDLLEALGEQSYNSYRKILKQHGLVLDYVPLLNYFLDFLPDPESEYQKKDVTNEVDHKLLRVLLRLAHHSRTFFDDSSDKCLTDITQFVTSSLSPKTVSIVLPILAGTVPYHYFENKSCMDMFKFLFSIWKNSLVSAAVDVQWYQFLSDIVFEAYNKLITEESPNIISKAKIQFGDYGFLNEEQIDFILNRLRISLIKECDIASFTTIITTLVYSINGPKMLQKVKRLMNSLETYIHPSNTGRWSKLCSKFVMTFIKIYHQRAKLEEQSFAAYRSHLYLTQETHSMMVNVFQEPIFNGSLSKYSKFATCYISSLAYLIDLNPLNKMELMDRVLIEIYTPYPHSIEREIVALKQFGRIARFYCSTDIYRMHITNVMTIIINKIDPNDPDMGVPLLNCLLCIMAFTPLEVLEDKDFYSCCQPYLEKHILEIKSGNHSTSYNEEYKFAFEVSTTLFKPIVDSLISKFFTFVSSKAEETMLFKITQLFLIMIESMDLNIFEYFCEKFMAHLFDDSSYLNCLSPNVEIVAVVTGYMVKRNNKLFKPLIEFFLKSVEKEVEQSRSNVRSKELHERDNRLVFYLTVLNETFRNGMSEIVANSSLVEKIIFTVFDNITNPPVDMISSLMIHNILASLTTTEIIDYRLFAENNNLTPSQKWGGFTSDDQRFSKTNMDYKWHTPTNAEVDYSLSLSERLLNYSSEAINRITAQQHLTTEDKDQLQKNILISIHVVTGLAFLVDSEYNEIKKLASTQEASNNKNKLTILNQVRKNSVDANIIESGFENDNDMAEEDEDVVSIEVDATDEDQMEIENSLYGDLMSVETTPLPGDVHEFGTANGFGIGNGFTLGNEKITIYHLNYFFGSTNEEKLSDIRYEKVHDLHYQIGHMLHNLVDFIKGKHEHNTQLLKIIFQGMKCWFIDRGRELFFEEEETSNIDLDLMENIQSLAHRFEPYTRTCIGLRIDMEYKARVMTHSTSRVPSKLEKTLLNDILILSISPYPDVCSVAQTGLTDVMKQILGSYKICINFLIQELNKSLAIDDELVTLSILQCIGLKKITSRLSTDYMNTDKLFDLLMKCSGNSDFKIVKASEQILNLLSADIKIPSSVCQFNFACLEGLNPKDQTLRTQLAAVCNAKDKKRSEIFDMLTVFRDSVLTQMEKWKKENKEISEWKSQLFIADIINRLQSSYEFETNLVSIKEIFNQTLSTHPEVKKNAVNAFMYVVSNALVRAEINYDKEKIYKSCFDRPFVKTIDTTGLDARKYYEDQIVNFDSPDFFIDAKVYNGFVTLGWPLYAVSSDNTDRFNLKLKPEDLEILKEIASKITPAYLKQITDFLVKENETKSKFSHLNVCFFVIIIQMINLEIAENITYQDILSICDETFDKNVKSSMITSGEIFASLILASKYTLPKCCEERDEFIDKYMSQHILKNMNKDISSIFGVILWWIPSQVDIRRCKKLYEKSVLSITEVLTSELAGASNHENISPALISGRINFARHVLMATPSTSEKNKKIGELFNVFNHPDEPVRKNVANTLNLLMITDSQKGFDNVDDLLAYVGSDNEDQLGSSIKVIPEWFDDILLKQFDWIFQEYESNMHYYKTTNAKDIINTEFYFRSSTIYHLFAGWVYNNLVSLPYYFEKIIKFLSLLYEMKNVCTMTNIHPEVLLENMALTTMTKPTLKIVLDVIFRCEAENYFNSAHGFKIQLQFIENLYSMYIYLLTKEQLLDIVAFVKNLLYYKGSLEVREQAGKVLSGIIHTLGQETPLIQELCQVFEKQLKRAGMTLDDKAQYVSKSKKKEAQIHGAVIGMSSVINAFPYIQPLPHWIPENISVLSRWTRFTGFIGTTTKNSISDFKKNRSDTWHLDKESFTLDQLEDLEGVNWRSYYA